MASRPLVTDLALTRVAAGFFGAAAVVLMTDDVTTNVCLVVGGDVVFDDGLFEDPLASRTPWRLYKVSQQMWREISKRSREPWHLVLTIEGTNRRQVINSEGIWLSEMTGFIGALVEAYCRLWENEEMQ